MGKVLIHPPVPFFIGIGKRTSSNLATDAHVIQFVLHTEQTCGNISKAPNRSVVQRTGKDIDRDT